MLQSESRAPANAPLARMQRVNVIKPRAGQPWIEDVADAVAPQIEGEPSNPNLEAAERNPGDRDCLD